jgi:hypothetical protein
MLAIILLRNDYFLKYFLKNIYWNNFFLNWFFILSHQNNTKTSKNINLNERKKIKKFQFFFKYFWKANTDML